MNFCEKKIDSDKMQSFLDVVKTFKFAAILIHHSQHGMSCDVDQGTRDCRLKTGSVSLLFRGTPALKVRVFQIFLLKGLLLISKFAMFTCPRFTIPFISPRFTSVL